MNRRWSTSMALLAILGLAVFTPAPATAGGTDYNPPDANWNGYKVYLSPSNQTANVGCDNYVESTGARDIALAAKNTLVAYGYKVRIGDGGPAANTSDSNAWGSSVHIPIHSNAGTWDCPGDNNARGGTWLGYGKTGDYSIALAIYNAMKSHSPGTSDRIDTDLNLSGTTTWGELRNTTMPAGYVEAAFHTFGPDTTWLKGVTVVANDVATGIDNYFGNPRCPSSTQPCPQSGIAVSLPEDAGTRKQTLKPSMPATGEQFPELASALAQLFDGPAFSNKTSGLLKKALINGDTAIVDLGDLPLKLPAASTAAGSASFFKPVNSIVFSFPNVKAVVYQINGSEEAFSEWLGTAGDPLTREQWESIKAAR